MIFAKGITTAAAITTRSRVGGSVGGFIALLNAVGTIALFGLLLILARGLLVGTKLEGFVSIPIILPLGVVAFGLVLVWLLRGLGLRALGEPLISDGVPDSFTGHAAEFWWRFAKGKREWSILERLQPTVLVVLGLVLAILPWTRAVGLFLLIAALLVSRRAIAERRAEDQRNQQLRDNDPYARVVAPPKGVASTPTCEAQLLAMDPAHQQLLDEQSRTMLVADRDRILAEDAAAAPPIEENPVTKRVMRDAMPAVAYGTTSRNILVLMLLLIGNFAAGDIVGVYRFMPEGFTGVAESLDREIAVLRPQGAEPKLGTGALTRELLADLDPAALQGRDDEAREVARLELQATLDAFATAREEERHTARTQLGVEFHPDAGTADFDAMLLEDEQARRTWNGLLNAIAEIDRDHRSGYAFAEGIGSATTGDEIKTAKTAADGLFDRLAAITADRLTLHTKLSARLGRTP